MTTIGVISDTHGYLSPAVAPAFRGVARILHAGDIDTAAVMRQLEAIAPLTAVRGNVDNAGEARSLSRTELVDVDGVLICVCHSTDYLDLNARAAGVRAVVYGHTHRPAIETREGVLWLNPGSASRPRGGFAPSVALMTIEDGRLDARHVDLTD